MARWGINLLQLGTWPNCRPFLNEARHAGWPMKGGFGGALADTRLEPGVSYTILVVDNPGAMAPGRYTLRHAPALTVRAGGGLSLDVSTGLLSYDGVTNGWLTVSSLVDISLADVYIDIYPEGTTHPAPVFKREFLRELAPYLGCVRLMDWNGAFSAQGTLAPEAGYSAMTKPQMELPWYWSASQFVDTGVLPQFCHIPGARAIWLNPPLLIARDRVSLLAWLRERLMGLPVNVDVLIAPSNECWNLSFPQAQYLRAQSDQEFPNLDSSEGMALLYSRWCAEMKGWIAGAGLRAKVVLEWQNAGSGSYPFSQPSWTSEPVQAEARSNLAYVGHAAVAPYFGSGAISGSDLSDSIREPLEGLREWKKIAGSLDVKLHVYEGGQHCIDDAESLQESGFMGPAYRNWLSGIEAILDDDAYACLYGLTGGWSHNQAWGMTENLGDSTEKSRAVIGWLRERGKYRPLTDVKPVATTPASIAEAWAALKAAFSNYERLR